MAGQGINEDELKKEIAAFTTRYKNEDEGVKTEEFQQFRDELMPLHYTLYEKACNFCGNILAIKADPAKEAKLQESLDTCHLNTTPGGVTAFAILFPVAFLLTGFIFSFLLTTLFMEGKGLFFFVFVFVVFGIGMIIPFSTLPSVLANNWRLRASNQMVLSIFYVVSYMRHTSNLERAIKFTSDHISPPLSLDFKRLIWDVESGKYNSIKQSIDKYLETWKNYNMEFVEAMHLIEASLYEANEKKRIESLEKSLSLILEATYEKMLHFAQNLKSPITMLHMLGIILPILGLVILPLVVSFMGGVEWYHISVIYNGFFAVLVWYLGKVILSTRPTGYGQADITEVNPELVKYKYINLNLGGKEVKIDPKWISVVIIIIFAIGGLSPLLIDGFHQLKGETYDIIVGDRGLKESTDPEEISAASFNLLGYKINDLGKRIGPYGLGATLLSLLLPLGVALGISFYFSTTTKKLILIREKTKALENEFASALFQLGNRIGDGLPAEIAFAKVSEIMENTVSGKFFDLVSTNVATLGMGVEHAIFDKRYGAINKFPSALIESSMKVFVESAKKGPEVASQALINISTYIKEMHRVDERLQDLMAEITSSMKSQINFMAPLISGIVIGLTSMITTILNTLGKQIGQLSTETGTGPEGLLDIFGDSIPTFYFQLIVGLYVVQITYLLTGMLNTIQNGYDPLNEKHMLGIYVKKSGIMYCIVALVVIILFNMIAGTVVSMNIVS
ncbi:hypothetical protein JXC34_02075 [Candidatus Woesearchaeota archaeon]|nr:hypothetical protein [Candidatus Woesearchaeota archaeon]